MNRHGQVESHEHFEELSLDSLHGMCRSGRENKQDSHTGSSSYGSWMPGFANLEVIDHRQIMRRSWLLMGAVRFV